MTTPPPSQMGQPTAVPSPALPKPTPTKQDPTERALHIRLCAAGLLVAMTALVSGGWVAQASLSSAVIASGLVVVDSNAKKVQHPTGGIVTAIAVKNGDLVRAGDIVLRLDDTQARANLGLVTSQLVQLTGRKARLIAERDGKVELRFPPGFLQSDPEAPAVLAGELQLFHTRRQQRVGQQDQLRQRISQLGKEVEGLAAQEAAKSRELKLVREEYNRTSDLHAKKLIPTTRITTLERDLARLEGERGQLVAQTARAGGQIAEIELQITGIDQTLQSEAGREIREIEARIAELMERKIAADDQLKRVDLRAPQTGTVHELSVFTVGGVINAGEIVMMIVPIEDQLAIEVRVAPSDIDQVSVGRRTKLTFPSLNRNDTPEIQAEVARVAADLTRETQSGASYFVARIRATGAEMEKLKKIKLVPGMPVEAYIEGGERTAWSYMMKPITDQIRRAFREE